jgi:MoxR-like ATPase
VAPSVRGYMIDIVEASRTHPGLAVGASPRAAIALRQASRAMALSSGRHYVIPSDVQLAVEPALGHRIVLLPGSERSGTGAREIVTDLLHQVPIPRPETAADARPVS